MKITFKTAAQFLLLLAACLTAGAQSEIAPDHFPDASPVAFAPRQQAQVQTLQSRLDEYQNLLSAKMEQVEQARQEAISAAAMGDAASAYIDLYRQQQLEAEALRAELAPQMDQTRRLIAGANAPANFR